jgi:hypothetical protein
MRRSLRQQILLTLTLSLIFTSCSRKKREEAAEVSVSKPVVDTFPRSNITFILGKDEGNHNPYYSLANQYYRVNDLEKTEVVIDTMISLLEVRNYLENHCPENGRPWGLINLVSHGNEFVDLSVFTTPVGCRVSPESLNEAIADSVLIPLDSTIVDSKTLFNLHGCAVGNNSELLNTLAVTFGGKSSPAKVKASKLFEYYSYTGHNRDAKSIKHFYAKVWYAYYKADTIPDDSVLAEQLKAKYPADSMDWITALKRQYPANPSQAYHMSLNIPVVWEDFFESRDELPDLTTKKKQNAWIKSKREFLSLMNKTHIPREYFSIKFYRLNYDTDSSTIYSSKIKAKAGVACIIKPVVEANNAGDTAPFIPKPDDGEYFGYSKAI